MNGSALEVRENRAWKAILDLHARAAAFACAIRNAGASNRLLRRHNRRHHVQNHVVDDAESRVAGAAPGAITARRPQCRSGRDRRSAVLRRASHTLVVDDRISGSVDPNPPPRTHRRHGSDRCRESRDLSTRRSLPPQVRDRLRERDHVALGVGNTNDVVPLSVIRRAPANPPPGAQRRVRARCRTARSARRRRRGKPAAAADHCDT